MYDFLGPAGIDLLLKDNGISGVAGLVAADSPDDVTLDFLDADGNKLTGLGGFGADAVEFKVRLGSTLVDTGATLGFNFDALAPALKLGIDGGLTFKLGWDMTIGFGVSLTDGFYITTNSDPAYNELQLQFEAGLSGRQAGFTVAPRAGSVSGFSIVDADGNWVLGPARGNGSRDILDAMPVDEGGEDYDTTLGAAPTPDECDHGPVDPAAPADPYWVVAVADANGDAAPAKLDALGQFRPQAGRDPEQMVEFDQTAPFAAFGSLFFLNLTAVDQIKVGLQPKGNADYFYDPSAASTTTPVGRNDADAGVNRNNALPTRIAGRIGVNLADPSAAAGDRVARPGPTDTGFMLMDGSDDLGGSPVLDAAGAFTPVVLGDGDVWYTLADGEPDAPITADESPNRITFNELREAGTGIFELDLSAEAVVNLNLSLSVSDDANVPRLTASLNLDWRTDSMAVGEDGEETRDLVPEVGLNDIRLDLGEFLTKFIKPIAEEIDGAIKPLDPVIDALKASIPVLSDLAGRNVRLSDLLTTFGGARGRAVAALIDMVVLVRELSAVMASVPADANIYLPIGNFWLAKQGDGLGSRIYYDNSEVTAPSITQRNQSLIADPGAGLNAATDALAKLDGLDSSRQRPQSGASDAGGFKLPILQDPMAVFRMLMGQDVPLVTFSLPKLDFAFDARIPLVRIVIFEVGLRFGLRLQGQLAVGYDTHGLKLFSESHNPADLAEGFYISDRANADGTGADVDELTLHATIALYGGVNLGLAKAWVEGALNLDAAVNLNDPNGDGKLRAAEAVELVRQTGNPLDLADLSLRGEVAASYGWWVGVEVNLLFTSFTVTFAEGGDTFARVSLFDLRRDGSDGPPVLAGLVTTVDEDGTETPGTLLLNMGPAASNRVSNQDPLRAADGAERFRIWNDADGSGTVHVQYGNYSNSYTQTFTGVNRVVAHGGAGDDVIDAGGLNGLPVEFSGGAGNDVITLGSASAAVASVLDGGDGNDVLRVAGTGNVRYEGGSGNDSIEAGTGRSTLDGGAGNDTLTGGGAGSENRFDFARSFGLDRLILRADAMANLMDFVAANAAIRADLKGADSKVSAGGQNVVTFDLYGVTEIRGTRGRDTFDLADPAARATAVGAGLVLRGGQGDDEYDFAADDLTGLSAQGITVDDAVPATAAAAVGAVDLDADCGEIKAIKIASGGGGYDVAPDVVITDPTGGGARAVAGIDASGAVTGIFLLRGGRGYTNPTVTFVQRFSSGDKLHLDAAPGGTVDVDHHGQFYDLSTAGGAVHVADRSRAGEVESLALDAPDGAVRVSAAIDLRGALKVLAGRLEQLAEITADTVKITTDRGLAAEFPINATSNGDVLLRVTGSAETVGPTREAAGVATVVDGRITAVAVTDAGEGYLFAPTVSFASGYGRGARAVATVSGGQVTGISVIDGGTGFFATPAPRVIVALPDGIKLDADVTSSTVGSAAGAGDGRGTVTLRSELGGIDQGGGVAFPAGSGVTWSGGDLHYASAKSLDDITPDAYADVAGGTGATARAVLDADGRVAAVEVVDGGGGYAPDLLPSVVIAGGATATATVGDDGKVSGFRVTYPGEGYADAPPVRVVANAFGKIVGGSPEETRLNRNHIKSAGGALVATAFTGIGTAENPLKTDVETMVAQTLALHAPLNLLEKDGTRVGLQDHVNGLSTDDGDVKLTSLGGTVALGQPVQQTDAAGNLVWQDADQTIPVYARKPDGGILYKGGRIDPGDATIQLTADDIDVNSFVGVGGAGGTLVLQPTNPNAPIGLNGTQAHAEAVIGNGVVTGFANLWDGRGYEAAPLVTLTPPGERAFGVASAVAGRVGGVRVTFGGTRYNAAHPPTITLVGGGLNGAEPAAPATAVAAYDAGGAVTGVTILDAGAGYYSAPEVHFALPGEQATARALIGSNGRVTGLQIVNAGSNYATPPVVTIADPFPFSLKAEEIGYFQDGFDQIIVGRADGRHTFQSADASFGDGIELRSPLGGSIELQKLEAQDAPVVVAGSGHTLNLTAGSPFISGTFVEIDDNLVVGDAVDAAITATAGHVSIFGAGKGKIDGVFGSTSENLTLTDVGDVTVAGAIGSVEPINNLTINSTGRGTVNLQRSVALDGDLHIVRGGNLNFAGDLSIGGNLIIDEGASVDFAGNVSVGGSLTVRDAAAVSFARDVTTGLDLTLGLGTAVGQVRFATGGRLSVGGTLTANSAGEVAFGTVQTLGPIRVAQASAVSFAGTLAAASLKVDRAADVSFAQDVTLAGALTFGDGDAAAVGQARFAVGTRATVGGPITADATGALNFSSVSTADSLTVNRAAAVTFAGTVGATDLAVNRATDVSFAQDVALGGGLSLGHAADPTRLRSVTFAPLARLDAAGAVAVYASEDIDFGGRVGRTTAPTSVTLRSETGDATFAAAVSLADAPLTIQKARDVAFSAELTAGRSNILDAAGQTRFDRAVRVGTLNVTSRDLIVVSDRLDLRDGGATFTTDDLDFDGGEGSVRYVGNGPATLTVRPATPDRAIRIGSPPGGGAALDVSDSDLLAVAGTFNEVALGLADRGTGAVTIGSIGTQQGGGTSRLHWSTRIYGGSVRFAQAVDSAAGVGYLKAVAQGGDVTVDAPLNATAPERPDVVELRSTRGRVRLNAPAAASAELRLLAADSVTAGDAASINAPRLAVDAGGTVSLADERNRAAVVAIRSTGHPVTFRNDGDWAIGAVAGVNGLDAGPAAVALTTNAGRVTQDRPVLAGQLTLRGEGGAFELTSDQNDADTLTADLAVLHLRDRDGLRVAGGLYATGDAALTVGGDLRADRIATGGNFSAVAPAGFRLERTIQTTRGGEVAVNVTGGAMTLDNGSAIDADGKVSLLAAGGIATGARVTTTGDAVRFNSPVTLTAYVGVSTRDRTGKSAGPITFSGPVDGLQTLSLSTDDDLTFADDVGVRERLNRVLVNSARNVTLAADLLSRRFDQGAGTGKTTVLGTLSTTHQRGLSINAEVISIAGALGTRRRGTARLSADRLVAFSPDGRIWSNGGIEVAAPAVAVANGAVLFAARGADTLLTADSADLAGAAGTITGSGPLVIQPMTPGRPVRLGTTGGDAAAMELSTAELASLGGGFSSIAVKGSGGITVGGDAAFGAPTLLQTSRGDIAVSGALSTDDPAGDLSLVAPGTVAVTGRVSIAGGGNLLLSGRSLAVGSTGAAASISGPASITLGTSVAGGSVVVDNAATRISGRDVWIGGLNVADPSTLALRGTVAAADDLIVHGAADVALDRFRLTAGDHLNVDAAGDLSAADGTFISRRGGVKLLPDHDADGRGALRQQTVFYGLPSDHELGLSLGRAALPGGRLTPGGRGSIEARVTNRADAPADSGFATVVVYASDDAAPDAADRLLGWKSFALSLAPGAGKDVTVDFIVPKDLAGGSYRLVAEVLPYAADPSVPAAPNVAATPGRFAA